jgi:4-amino-4-deoxy-L-arabinose transferase-like glycosyltransferase
MPERARSWAAPAGILLLAAAVRAWFLTGPQLDYDEGVYWQSLRALAAGHPLFSSVYSSQPPGFLLLLTPFYDLLGHSLAAARGGVALVSLLGIAAAYSLLASAGNRAVGIAAAALLLADPLYLRQSVTLQADGPALAIALAALAVAAWRSRPGYQLPAAGVGGALLAGACMVKLLALPAALPLLLLLWPSARRIVAAAVGGLVVVGLCLAPFAGILPLVLAQVIGLHLTGGTSSLGGVDGLLTLGRWEAPLALLALLGIIATRARAEVRLGLAWLAAAAIGMLAIHPLWPHHLVGAAVPLALVAAPAVALVVAGRTRLVAAGVVLLLGVGLASWVVVSEQRPPDQPAVDRIAQLAGPGQEVITDDQFGAALAGRDTPPELVDTSMVRVESGSLTAAEVEHMATRDRVPVIVFATGRLTLVPGLVDWAETSYPTLERIGTATILSS